MPTSGPALTAVRQAYDDQVRPSYASNLPPRVHAEVDGPVVRVVGEHRGFISSPPVIQLDSHELYELIYRQREFFAARQEAVEWKTWSHDQPADMPERLVGAGFVAEPTETVVIGAVGDIGDLAEKRSLDPSNMGVSVREAESDEDMHLIAQMESEVWGEDVQWLADYLIGRVASAPDMAKVLVAEASGQVVSAAWLVIIPGTEFAGLWGGSTLPDWRGRGIYGWLLARRAHTAAARGVRYLYVEASDDSLPILQRRGFAAVATTTPYVWTPDVRTPNVSTQDVSTPDSSSARPAGATP